MGRLDQAPEMADAFGCPEYFTTHVGLVEDAGGGNIRVVRCVLRSGVLIPVYSAISPATMMITSGPQIRMAAEAILKREMMGDGTSH